MIKLIGVRKTAMSDEDYLRQQLEWIKQRMEALGKVEVKLWEMRKLAEYASDNNLNTAEARELNAKLHGLQQEVIELDEKSKVFWMYCQ